jgi:predicted nucleic acid-binding protein
LSVLVDTSVWIEYFRERPSLSPERLSALAELIREDEVVTIEAIRAEVLSGRLDPEAADDIAASFGALRTIDLDWSKRSSWDELVELARRAHAARIAVPGLIDRTIVAAAQAASVPLWSLDPRLRKLAANVGVELI